MKKIFLVAIAVFALVSCQQQKIGFIDNAEVLEKYQSKIDLEADINAQIQAFQQTTDSLRQAFQLEINDAEIQARKMSQAQIQKLSQELQGKEQRLSQQVQFQQNQIAEQSRSKNDSIVKQLKDYVENYGKKNGFSYILGSNEAGSVIYGEEVNDLTQIIIDGLNAEYNKED